MSLSPFLLSHPPQKKADFEDPEKALAVAIKLLESKDQAGFVKRFMPPEDLARLLQKNDIDHIAKEEVGKRAEKWLREFTQVKGAKPVFNDKRTQATFSAKGTDGTSVDVKFRLIDGKWYLK